ncbi:MAG: HAD-IC family P-type ATPase, partial [Clostridia bacterium]|nr:HAD-IC family P-type ATPase [Clostridia bacterium]
FDKTGTLTEGAFHVVRTVPAEGWQAEELLYYAAHAEAWSSHPAAQSLRNAYGRPVEKDSVTDVTEEAGYGVSALVYGHRVLAGNLRLMERHGISCRAADTEPGESPVYAAVDGVFAGWIAVSDRIRDDAQALMRDLRKAGFRKTVMLTGDRADAGERIGRMLEMDEIRGGLLPGDKVAAVEELLAGKRPGETLVYLGDGINDAPVLARADVGAAMGGLGSDAAMEAADIVIMTDAPSRLAAAVQIARKTMGIVRQNIVFAIGVKVLVMLCSVLGYANMWMAVFADVGVSVLAIANALRCMKKR